MGPRLRDTGLTLDPVLRRPTLAPVAGRVRDGLTRRCGVSAQRRTLQAGRVASYAPDVIAALSTVHRRVCHLIRQTAVRVFG